MDSGAAWTPVQCAASFGAATATAAAAMRLATNGVADDDTDDEILGDEALHPRLDGDGPEDEQDDDDDDDAMGVFPPGPTRERGVKRQAGEAEAAEVDNTRRGGGDKRSKLPSASCSRLDADKMRRVTSESGHRILRSTLDETLDDVLEAATHRMRQTVEMMAGCYDRSHPRPWTSEKVLVDAARNAGLLEVAQRMYWQQQLLARTAVRIFLDATNEFIANAKVMFASYGATPLFKHSTDARGEESHTRWLRRRLPVCELSAVLKGAGGCGPTVWLRNPWMVSDSQLEQMVKEVLSVTEKSVHTLTLETLAPLKRSLPAEMALVVDFLVTSCLPGEHAAALGVPRGRQRTVCARFKTISKEISTNAAEAEREAKQSGAANVRKAVTYRMRQKLVIRRVLKNERYAEAAALRDITFRHPGVLAVMRDGARLLGSQHKYGKEEGTRKHSLETPHDSAILAAAVHGQGTFSGHQMCNQTPSIYPCFGSNPSICPFFGLFLTYIDRNRQRVRETPAVLIEIFHLSFAFCLADTDRMWTFTRINPTFGTKNANHL